MDECDLVPGDGVHMRRVLVTGGRDADPSDALMQLTRAVADLGPITFVVGDAAGVDAVVRQYAEGNNISCEVYKADWDQYGKSAGPIRNATMVDSDVDLCLAFPTCTSKGTWQCIRMAVHQRIPTRVQLVATSQRRFQGL